MSFFTGFGVSSLVYYVLNRLFPVPGMQRGKFHEVDESNYDYMPSHPEAGGSDMASVDSKTEKDPDVKVHTVAA
jgi:NCS1 family nucleobase:cation symporter-1